MIGLSIQFGFTKIGLSIQLLLGLFIQFLSLVSVTTVGFSIQLLSGVSIQLFSLVSFFTTIGLSIQLLSLIAIHNDRSHHTVLVRCHYTALFAGFNFHNDGSQHTVPDAVFDPQT